MDNIVKMLRQAKDIADKEGVPVEYVLRMMEVESKQMASALIAQMYVEIQSINKLLQEMKQFDDMPPKLRRL